MTFVEDEERNFYSTTLEIHKATSVNHGQISCYLENSLKGNHLDIFVQVLNKPRNVVIRFNAKGWKNVDHEIVITEFNSYTLRCISTDHPDPSVIWFKDEKQISSSAQQNDLNLTESGMANHQGRYKCVAENRLGSTSKVVNLKVAILPHYKGQKTKLSQHTESQAVTLRCDVRGFPAPSISWHLNDILLEADNQFSMSDNNNTLKFTLTTDMAGSYSCNASNAAGKTSRVFEVLLVGKSFLCTFASLLSYCLPL